MKTLSGFNAILMLALIAPSQGRGQSALPFLLISPAPDGNGRGNISTAVPSENPIAVAVNPGQLGLFSLRDFFAGSSYAGKTDWFPAFGQPDLTYNVWALSAGYNSSDVVSLPFSFGFGLGYSKIDFDLGEFIRTGSGGPEEIGRFNAYGQAKNFSVGLGLEYVVRLGIGWNFKSAHSVLGPISIGPDEEQLEAEASVTDFGVILQIPVVSIVDAAMADTIRVFDGIAPLVDLNFGYVIANRGDDPVRYFDGAQADYLVDPLPRNAITGLSLELGFTRNVPGNDWKVISFTIAREAEDLLVVRDASGGVGYKPGWGDISFFRNVVSGKTNACVNILRGWELNLGDMVLLRGGSYAEDFYCGNRNYSTSGYAIRLRGFLNFLEAVSHGLTSSVIISFLRDHVDLRYDHAGYEGPSLLAGTEFNSLTLVLR